MTKFDLGVKWVKVNPGDNLYSLGMLGSTRIQDDKY